MQAQFLTFNGHRYSYYHLAGEGDPIVFFHATGFHAHVWLPVVEHLAGKNVYLFDMPGHGQSDQPADKFNWGEGGQIMAALISELGLNNITGVGHSMGAHMMLLVASLLPERFTQVLALDPVVIPEKFIPLMNQFDTSAMGRRRNDWASVDEFYQAYIERTPFKDWHEPVFKAYAEHGLKPSDGKDKFELACSPAWEASVYNNFGAELLHQRFSKITMPVHIVRAKSLQPGDNPMDFSKSPTGPTVVKKMPNATEDHQQEFTHFFPMEHPQFVSNKIEAMTQ